MKLIATRNQTYNTRHLVAGAPFEAPDPMGRAMIAVGKARAAEPASPRRGRPPSSPAPAPAPAVATVADQPEPRAVGAMTSAAFADDDEITRLRKTARRLGIIVDRRWGSQTLRDKIAQVQG